MFYVATGIWITCFVYHGRPTDERWEWGCGTETKIEGTGTYGADDDE